MDWDHISELILDNIEKLGANDRHDIYTEQPKHASWLSVDVDMRDDYPMDHSAYLEYDDEQQMHAALTRAIVTIASPEILEQVRNGKIMHLSFRIGPRAISGMDLNKDLGISEFIFS